MDSNFITPPYTVPGNGPDPYYGNWWVLKDDLSLGSGQTTMPAMVRSGAMAGAPYVSLFFPVSGRVRLAQDVCVNLACPTTVCAWMKVNAAGDSARMFIHQLDAAHQPLGPALGGPGMANVTQTAWTQVCITVGGPAYPYDPAAAELRVEFSSGFANSAMVSVDDVSLSQACPAVTLTPTVPFYQQPDLVKERGVYPNPFTDRVRIFFTLRVDAEVVLDIYNVAGEPIFHKSYAGRGGMNEIVWEGLNEVGQKCSSGVYLVRARCEGVDRTSGSFWTTVVIVR